MSLILTNHDGSLFVNNNPQIGPTGMAGINAASSISYILQSTSGGDVSGSNYFTTCCNTFLSSTNIFVFAYVSLNNITSQGIWDTIENSITNGQTVYLQITELGNPGVTLLSKVNSVVYTDPGNGGQYTITCDLPPVSATGNWNASTTYVVSFNIAGSIGDTGPAGQNGVNAATSISYNLQSTSGGNISGSQNFTSCCNVNLISTYEFVFAYIALNNISSEGIWDTVIAALTNGQTVYLQITELNNPNVTLLSKINSVIFNDPGNNGQYTVTCDLPVNGSGIWTTSTTYVVSFNFSGQQGPTGPQGPIVLSAINLSSYAGSIDTSGNLSIDLSNNTINMCINDVGPLDLYVNRKLLYSSLQVGSTLPVNVYNNGIAYTTGLAT